MARAALRTLDRLREGGSALVRSVAGELDLRVTSLDGTQTPVTARRGWVVRDIKSAVENTTGLPRREQRLVFGTRELQDHEPLDALDLDNFTNLNLIKRAPLQAEWLETVSLRPLELRQAPCEIQSDAEVVLAAADHDVHALLYASGELWGDRDFVLAAVRKNWHTWLEHVSPELRADKEVVLAVMTQHGRAIRYVAKQLSGDPEVVLAALHQRPKHASFVDLGALETMMDEHVALVFQYVGPELRANCGFMVAAMDKDWHTYRYAAPQLWEDPAFVLEAVRYSGDLLGRAAEGPRSNRDVVAAAVSQDGHALAHAGSDLHGDRELVVMAVRQHGLLPQYIGARLRRDPRVLLAIAQHRLASVEGRISRQMLRMVDPRPQPNSEHRENDMFASTRFAMCCLLIALHALTWLTLGSGPSQNAL